MEQLKIEYVPVDQIKEYKHNAKLHPKEQVQQIANSIKQFGMNDPIGIWSDENIIVEGHGRLMAAKKLGMTEVPCIRLDCLTDEQRKAYALAHNKTAELSEWDFAKLKKELSEMSFNMEDFGFWTPDAEEQAPKNETMHKAKTIQARQIVCPRCGSVNVRKAANNELED